jgi:protein SCO1/2
MSVPTATAWTTSRSDAADERFALVGFLVWFAVTVGWWALAFAPLPAAEAWLAAARAVCFGSLPNGLPEPWGWMLLVLAPATMLAFLVVVWGRPLVRALGALARRPAGALLIANLAGVALAGSWFVGGRIAVAARTEVPLASPLEPLPESYPRGAQSSPPLRLTDQTGAAFDLAALRGRPVIVTFAYGHCATVCPLLVASVRAARERYGASPPAVVVVTLDPWRDTPRALPGLARAWGLDTSRGEWLLGGSVPEVVAAAEAWEIGFARDETSGEITHSSMVLLLDADGRIAYRFLGPPAHWLIAAARRLEPGA